MSDFNLVGGLVVRVDRMTGLIGRLFVSSFLVFLACLILIDCLLFCAFGYFVGVSSYTNVIYCLSLSCVVFACGCFDASCVCLCVGLFPCFLVVALLFESPCGNQVDSSPPAQHLPQE